MPVQPIEIARYVCIILKLYNILSGISAAFLLHAAVMLCRIIGYLTEHLWYILSELGKAVVFNTLIMMCSGTGEGVAETYLSGEVAGNCGTYRKKLETEHTMFRKNQI